ncbi:MAG: hypothetical protein ABMA01_20405 [Chthoniobacteraceae bacterium]
MDDSGTLDLSAVYSDLAGPEHLIRSPVAALPPMSAKMSGRLTSFLARQGPHPGGKGYEGKFRKPSSSEPPDDIVSWQ